MWKKTMITVVALIGIVSVTYLCSNNTISRALNASGSTTYNAGGEVSGRVNKAPSSIVGNSTGFQIGDRFYSDTINPNDLQPMAWMVLAERSYKNYDNGICTPKERVDCSNDEVTGLYTLSERSIGESYYGLTIDMYKTAIHSTYYSFLSAYRYAPYSKTLIAEKMKEFNSNIGAIDTVLLAPRDETFVKIKINNAYAGIGTPYITSVPADHTNNSLYFGNEEHGKKFFVEQSVFDYEDIETDTDVFVPRNYSWSAPYYSSTNYSTFVDYTYTHMSYDQNGELFAPQYCAIGPNDDCDARYAQLAIRPAAYFDKNKIVFGVSKGNSSNVAAVNLNSIKSDYTSLYEETRDDKGNHIMKIRYEDPTLTASTELYQIESSSGDKVTEIGKGGIVYLNANADAGVTQAGVNTVSALVFDENGDFVYYKPLAPANGTDSYEFDLTGISKGVYRIGIVNEVYDETSEVPTISSLITETQELEILGGVEEINVTLTPQNSTDFEYKANVNKQDKVAEITSSGGVSPITFSIVSDTSQTGHENDYLKFALSKDNSGNSIVIVKDINGLDAGDYYFKVHGVDFNGNPIGGTESNTIHINVKPISTSIAFNDPTTTTKSITDASISWSETATYTPIDPEVTLIYTKSGGDVGLIDIDPTNGAITYKGSNVYGKVTIRATIDDASSTGKDNYTSSYVEKDIVIYKEVDGSVTPDSASSDSTNPTFSATDINVKPNGVIGTISGSKGTPDTIDGSDITYKYGIKNIDDYVLFSVDPSTGVITANTNINTGTYSFVVTVSDAWSTKEIPVSVIVQIANAEPLKFYEHKNSSTIITTKSVSLNDKTSSVFATVKGSTNTNQVRYKIKDGSTNVITINPTSGDIIIKGTGTVVIVAEKDGIVGQANASAKLTFIVTSGTQSFIYIDAAGNELSKTGDKYTALTETYAVGKKIQLYTSGSPAGSTITYKLKDPNPVLQDVISVNSSTGEVTVLNASLTSQLGKIIVIATSHDPTGNYVDASIELPININKGNRVVSFVDNPIYVTSGTASVTPDIEIDGVLDTTGKALIEIDPSETDGFAWTDDSKTIKYDYNGKDAIDIKLNITVPTDRNYLIANATGTLHIMGADESVLAITTPGKIIYGDHFTIKCTQDDDNSTNVQYTFDVNDTTYISAPTVTGKEATFDALKVSGTNTITVTVTRTADGEVSLTKKVSIKVLPKPIEITIDHKEKLKGEANPELTYQDFSSQLVSWNDTKDVIQPNDIKLSTTANETSTANDYPIKGDSVTLNKTYPNYSFTFKENTLTITEENIEDDWYHLELDDGNNTPYVGTWTNQNVNIISDHIEYVHLSRDQSTWETPQISISTEGKNEQSFWMKKDSGATTSEKKEFILIDKTEPVIKSVVATDTNNVIQDIINQLTFGIFFKPGTSFEITTSDAKDDIDTSGTVSIDYKIYKQEDDKSYGSPMKQDTLTVTDEKAKVTISDTTGTYKICVLPKDNAGNIAEEETCKEITLKKINVDIDGDENPDFNDSDGDGCPDLNIKWKAPTDDKKWVIVNGDRDQDGIPDLNIDSNGDGKADLNIDTDNDGKPDLNLVILKKSDWVPEKCVLKDESKGIMEEYCTGTSVKAVINIDTGTDHIPDINIDNIGDFKPHLNISKDGKTPIINIVKLHDWKPNKDYNSSDFSYDSIGTGKDDPKPELNIDTDNDGRPDINLDLNGDGTPELNIDGDGDGIPDVNIDAIGNGEPDYNIDVSGNGYAEENIIKLTEWKPEKNADTPFAYDTMEIAKKDQVEDGGVIVVDPGGNFLPNHAIKVDNITDQLDEETKEKIANQAGEQEVKTVYDVKFLEDNIETQPNGSVKVKVPVDTSIKNPKLIVEQKDGSYKVVEGTYEDGYLTYETDYVGKVSVIGDHKNQGKDEPKDDPEEPEPPIEPTEPEPTPKPAEPKPTVQGTYTSDASYKDGNNMGGVSTGDTSDSMLYLSMSVLSFTMLFILRFLLQKHKNN